MDAKHKSSMFGAEIFKNEAQTVLFFFSHRNTVQRCCTKS